MFESNCHGGNFEIYRGTLNYSQDKTNELTVAALISPTVGGGTRLTNNNSDDRYPRVGPDGTIAFTATRDGNPEIYTMTLTGSQQARVTTSNAADEAPTWAPDGTKLVFGSNRDGDFEIIVMNRDGGGQVQLTNNDKEDRWPIWAQ